MKSTALNQYYKLKLNPQTSVAFSEKGFREINLNSELNFNYIDFINNDLCIDNKLLLVKNLLNASVLLGMKKWHLFDVESSNDDLVPGIDPEKNEDYQEYCWGLLSSFVTTGATPLVAEYLYEKFLADGSDVIANHYKEIKIEEGPHQKLCKLDLNELGVDYQKIFSLYTFEKEDSLVEYFWKLAKSKEPLSTLGYAYALEKTALIFNTPKRINEIKDLLGSKENATRCLKAHASNSHEKEHVEDSLRLISTLSNKSITEIAKAALETSSKMNNPFLKIKKL